MGNIAKAIYSLWESREEAPRKHLGASVIGGPCERAIQLQYRKAFTSKFSGRMLRLFDVGHRFEDRLVSELRGAGFNVMNKDQNGDQYRLGPADGLCGSCDGFIEIDGAWGVLEAKTHNDKSFNQVKKSGVEASKPQHYSQMQVYMGYSGRTFALYCAENKNTSELYFETVDFNQKAFDDMVARGQRVINSNEELPKVAGASDTFYICQFCDAHAICHDQAVPDVNCRTCMHWNPVDQCGLHGKECFGPCPSHVFHPMLMPSNPVLGDKGWVLYEDGLCNCAVVRFPDLGDEYHWGTLTSEELRHCQSFDKARKVAEVKDEFGGTVVASSD